MRALVLAFDCNPILPSLPIVAFNTCAELARRADITVVSYRQPEVFEVPGARETVFIDIDWLKEPVDKVGVALRGGNAVGWGLKTAFTYPSYVAWELMVWKRFKARLRAGEFDLIYRVSPMSPVLPSPIAKRAPVPFVIGPINGGLEYPKEARGLQWKEHEWLHGVRRAHRHLPYYRSTYEDAAAILAGFDHTIADLPESARRRAICFPEVGFDPEIFFPPPGGRQPAAGRPLHFLFAGRMVPYKAPAELARAFVSQPELAAHRLTFVGEGPELAAVEAAAGAAGFEGRIDLLGATDQRGVAGAMREADVFAFPSLRELGAGVVVEAMACGLPCLVADTGAPAALVGTGRGVKVPLAAGAAFEANIAAGLLRFAREPGLASRLGAEAERYAQGYRWDRKADHLAEVLRWALAPAAEPKPSFY